MKKFWLFTVGISIFLLGYGYFQYLYADINISTMGILWQDQNEDFALPVQITIKGEYGHSQGIGELIEGKMLLAGEGFYFEDTITLSKSKYDNWAFIHSFMDGEFVEVNDVENEYGLSKPYFILGDTHFESAIITFHTKDNPNYWTNENTFVISYPIDTRTGAVTIANHLTPKDWIEWK